METKQKPDQKRNQRSLSCISYNSREVGQWFLLFNIKGLIISLWHFLSAEGECLCLCVFNIISLSVLLFLFALCHFDLNDSGGISETLTRSLLDFSSWINKAPVNLSIHKLDRSRASPTNPKQTIFIEGETA